MSSRRSRSATALRPARRRLGAGHPRRRAAWRVRAPRRSGRRRRRPSPWPRQHRRDPRALAVSLRSPPRSACRRSRRFARAAPAVPGRPCRQTRPRPDRAAAGPRARATRRSRRGRSRRRSRGADPCEMVASTPRSTWRSPRVMWIPDARMCALASAGVPVKAAGCVGFSRQCSLSTRREPGNTKSAARRFACRRRAKSACGLRRRQRRVGGLWVRCRRSNAHPTKLLRITLVFDCQYESYSRLAKGWGAPGPRDISRGRAWRHPKQAPQRRTSPACESALQARALNASSHVRVRESKNSSRSVTPHVHAGRREHPRRAASCRAQAA